MSANQAKQSASLLCFAFALLCFALLCFALLSFALLCFAPLTGAEPSGAELTVLPHRALFSIVNGFCAGGFFSLTPGFIYSIVKEEQHPVAFSMIVSAWAPG